LKPADGAAAAIRESGCFIVAADESFCFAEESFVEQDMKNRPNIHMAIPDKQIFYVVLGYIQFTD
jgi:hypothetical protein